MKNIKSDFPLLQRNPKLVYFDSACTSLKPQSVIDAEKLYYEEYGACGGRSSHSLSVKTNEKIDKCRETVARFVGAKSENIVWTRNTTESLNLVLNSFDFSKRIKVVTTIMEHHSVLLPLLKLRDKKMIELNVLPAVNGVVSLTEWQNAVDKQTALVVTNSASNTTALKQSVREIAKICHDNGALICIDGAQGVPHFKTDFIKDDLDFLCFSGHKLLGPSGIGVLCAKTQQLDSLSSFLVGGGTVKTVSLDKVVPLQGFERFEAGVQHYAGIFGLAAACEYLSNIGMEKVEQHEKTLSQAMLKELKNAGAITYGGENRAALWCFNLGKAAAHEVALLLDKEKIAVRSGFFCAQPAVESLGAKQGAVRVSGYVYNDVEDVKTFGEALQKLSVLYR